MTVVLGKLLNLSLRINKIIKTGGIRKYAAFTLRISKIGN